MLNFTLNQHNTAQVIAFYQRLRLLDETLPAELPENKLTFYINALEKIKSDQINELNKLRSKHLDLVTAYLLPRKNDNHSNELDHVEMLDRVINEINMAIICSHINHETHILNLENYGITRFPPQLLAQPEFINYFNQLEEINLNNNFLRVLQLRNLSSLQYLDCEDNQLHTLKLENLPSLREIDLSDNTLEGSLDFRPFPKLYAIRLHNNKIQNINVSGLRMLILLDCSNNQLLSLHVDSPIIKDLNCSWNYLHNLVITEPTKLELPREGTIDEIGGLHLYVNALSCIPQNLVDKFGLDWANNEMIEQRDFGFTTQVFAPVIEDKPVLNANPELAAAFAAFKTDLKEELSAAQQPITEEKPAAVLTNFEATTTRMRTRSQTRNESSQQPQPVKRRK